MSGLLGQSAACSPDRQSGLQTHWNKYDRSSTAMSCWHLSESGIAMCIALVTVSIAPGWLAKGNLNFRWNDLFEASIASIAIFCSSKKLSLQIAAPAA